MHAFCELYYEDTHSKGQEFNQILVLVHGNLISSKYWGPLTKEIQKLDPKIRVIACDLRGFGASQQIQQVETMSDLSNDVDHLLTRLFPDMSEQEKSEKIWLVGWSLGGGVVMQLAVDYPNRYHKLILVASVGVSGYAIQVDDEQGSLNMRCQTKEQVANNSRVKRNKTTIDAQDRAFNRMVFEKVLFNSGKVPPEEEFVAYLEEVFKQTNYVDVCWALNNWDISGGKLDLAKNIVGPVLIYHGGLDLVIPPLMAEGNATEIGKEKCKVVIRDEVGHMPPMEEPREMGEIIVQFIKQL